MLPNQNPIRRRQTTFMPLFDEGLLADERVSADAVTPEERDSVLSDIGQFTGGTVARLADALSLPGDLWRGQLAGKPGERVTGRDLLRSAGIAGPEDTWWNFAGGLAADAITDPLSVMTGPAKALTPAGKAAARLAGPVGSLLDTAPTALTRKAISTGMADSALPMVARRTKDALQATGRKISTLDPATVGRPLYGVRTSRRAGTLDDLIKYADDPEAAEKAARQMLGDNQLNALRNQPLAKSFGVGLPMSDPMIVGDFLGKGFGDTYADVLDTAGQALRWSAPGRMTAALFDNQVGGSFDAEEQLTNVANWQARKVGGDAATGDHMLQLARLRLAHPEVFADEEGNRALGRYLEGPAVRKAEDVTYVESRPQLKAYADYWATSRQKSLAESRTYGLNGIPLTDKYGIDYLPRKADPALELAARGDRKLGQLLSVFAPDALQRKSYLQVPGGRDTIIDLSRDTQVSGSKRALQREVDASAYIRNKLNGMVSGDMPQVSRQQADRLARLLARLPDDVVQKSPLFGQHPTEMIGSYLTSKGQNIGTAKTLLDSLATFAVNTPAKEVAGSRHLTLPAALKKLGLRTYEDSTDDLFEVIGEGADAVTRTIPQQSGAAAQMRDRLGKLLGVEPDSISLNNFSIPEEHIDRLTRARDLYSTGDAPSKFMQALDHVTTAWKGSILAWPSRAIRDLYSGNVSNWLEGAWDSDSLSAASGLVMSGPQARSFLDELSKVPRWQGNDGVAQFYADLSRAGIVGSGQSTDIGASVLNKTAGGQMVGMDPISLSSIGSELKKGWNGKDFLTWRSSLKPLAETRNPVMRASERLNSLTDGINRISGWMALVKQGVDPMAAAARIKRAHVDYSSLSSFERNVMKQVFPWYSYQSRIFREVLRQIAERPGGRYGQLLQATERAQDSGEDSYVPAGLRSQFAYAVPAEFGGQPAPGTQTYVTDLDFPGFDQLNMLELAPTLAGTGKGIGRQIGMQMHPLARLGLESVTGQDLFTNRPIGESTSTLDAIARKVTGDPNADVPFLPEKLLEITPFLGRPLGVARTLLDDRGGQSFGHRLSKAGLNAVSGLKVRDVSQQDALSDAMRQIEESIDPYTRDFTQTFIPEQLQPSVPQWALRRLAVSRALARERRAERQGATLARKNKPKPKTDTGFEPLFS
jgi:hypothetical protein